MKWRTAGRMTVELNYWRPGRSCDMLRARIGSHENRATSQEGARLTKGGAANEVDHPAAHLALELTANGLFPFPTDNQESGGVLFPQPHSKLNESGQRPHTPWIIFPRAECDQ
jgi:hypothetical protein